MRSGAVKSGLLTFRGFTVATEELTRMHLAIGSDSGAVWLGPLPTGVATQPAGISARVSKTALASCDGVGGFEAWPVPVAPAGPAPASRTSPRRPSPRAAKPEQPDRPARPPTLADRTGPGSPSPRRARPPKRSSPERTAETVLAPRRHPAVAARPGVGQHSGVPVANPVDSRYSGTHNPRVLTAPREC